MDREALNEYKKKIMALSDEEAKLKDEYLKGFLDGTYSGPPVGDAFVDKPWLNRYKDNDKASFDANTNLYQLYLDMNKDRLDEIAVYVNEYKTKYTHRQIIDMVEKFASGLLQQNITSDSKVGIMLNGSIEEVVAFLAVQKIGATAKYIDYMKSVPAMKHSVDEDNLDYIIMDECFLPLNQVINEKGIKVAVAHTKAPFNDDKLISCDKLMEIGSNLKVATVQNKPDEPCLIINSSGTTGNPKPIVHTCESVNAAVKKILRTDYPVDENNVLLKMIPSQIGLGIITSLFTGLVSGSQVVIMVAKPEGEALVKDINDFVISFPEYIKENNLKEDAKVNIFTAPMFVRGLVFDERVQDLSRVGSILAAGSKMGEKELNEMNAVAQMKGCAVPICNGYGQNEMAGAISLNSVNHNLNGSAGYPTIDTDIIVVDPDTHELLSNNEIGLILERSGSKFKEYENMPEKTADSKIIINGKEYFNTCDLGYMNDNGYLFITGRTTRVVIRSDFKISLDDIEKKVNTIDCIRDSATIKGETNDSQEPIILFVELNDGSLDPEFVKNAIHSSNELSPFEQPSDIVIVEKIPYKDNGKKDYKLLENGYYSKEEDNIKKYR